MASISSTLKGKYPAKAHAKRVAERIQKAHSVSSGVIYLEGQKTRMIEDNDGEQPFRQRRYFYYLTGCNVPDCYYTYDISSQTSTLYIPPIDPSSVIWSGLPLSPEDALRNYEIDHVKYSTDVNPSLAGLPASSKSAVWAIQDQVSPHITFLGFDSKDFGTVKKAIEESRVVKDDYEIALTKHANNVSKIAHTAVLKAVKHANNERELEGLFIEKCIANGCREQAYHSIVAGGVNGATLHYQKNDEDLKGRLNLLLDAGGEYNCYASDITRTFPINGKWSKESREIYDTVLKMQLECTEMLKEGVLWESVHEHAHKVAIEGLLKIGILKGTAEEIFKSRTSVAFFPHGLGHYLGMDTHDTGGNPNYDDKDPMFQYLRVRGTLPAGSIITVEPGIYFCKFIILPYLENAEHAKYIDKDVLEKYWSVGGVRIEDNVLVTKSGYENLTTCTKDPVELEKIISSS